jgi:adenylate kinase family enzyme
VVPSYIHVTGASGAGTTTLGRVIADRLSLARLDTDDFFWVPTDPPFQRKREMPTRLRLLTEALDEAGSAGWVLSGSLSGWGDKLISRFQLVVFLVAPTDLRLRRLVARERLTFGADALAAGGLMHAEHAKFLAWAAAYDEGGPDMRSRAMHEAWLATLPCPVLRLDGALSTTAQLDRVLSSLP